MRHAPNCVILFILLFVFEISYAPFSVAQTTSSAPPTDEDLCISKFLRSAPSNSLGLAPGDAEALVSEILLSTGLSIRPKVVSCGYIKNAAAYIVEDDKKWPDDDASVRPGLYILYNPVWVQQVLGDDKGQAVVLIGHELGHLVNGDYTADRKTMSILQRETEADGFAGCSAVRMNISLDVLTNVLSRLRGESDTEYPSRENSLASAKSGYKNCKGPPQKDGSWWPIPTSEDPTCFDFSWDSSDLDFSDERAARYLVVATTLIGTYQGISLFGYGDPNTSGKYNLSLSQRRSRNVTAFLVSHGIGEKFITQHNIMKDTPSDGKLFSIRTCQVRMVGGR